jgi:hypothetical protein
VPVRPGWVRAGRRHAGGGWRGVWRLLAVCGVAGGLDAWFLAGRVAGDLSPRQVSLGMAGRQVSGAAQARITGLIRLRLMVDTAAWMAAGGWQPDWCVHRPSALVPAGYIRHPWAGHIALVRLMRARVMGSRCGGIGFARRANLRAGAVGHAGAALPGAAGRPVASDGPGVPVHCSARVSLGSPLLM